MEHLIGFVLFLIPLAAILLPIGILGIIFWYKARQRELDLQESLRLKEFEHLQRLKELELEIAKTQAHGSDK
jgi:hypothetical protein